MHIFKNVIKFFYCSSCRNIYQYRASKITHIPAGQFAITNLTNSKSITVHLDSSGGKKLIFNYPENYSKMSNYAFMDYYFFTSHKWCNYAGLLTLRGRSVYGARVHLPKVISEFFSYKKLFCDIDVRELKPQNYQLDNLTLKTIFFYSSTQDDSSNHNFAAAYIVSHKRSNYNNIYDGTDANHNKKLVEKSQKSLKEPFNDAKEHRVESSPECSHSRLKGEDASSDGISTFMVLDAPSIEYLDSLLSHPGFDDHYSQSTQSSAQLKLIIHLSPPDVVNHPKYQKFLNRFHTDAKHVLVGDESKSFGYHKFMNNVRKMRVFCPFVQNLYIENGTIPNSSLYTSELIRNNRKFIEVDSNFILMLKQTGFTYIRLKEDDPPTNSMLLDNKSLAVLDELKSEHQKNSLLRNSTKREYPNITFLGTGGTFSTPNRGESAILLELSDDKIVLLDCGIGTWHQMMLLYGPGKSCEVLRKIRLIYVTHCHSDHYEGLFTLLSKRKEAFKDSTVKAPKLSLLINSVGLKDLKHFHFNVEKLLVNMTTTLLPINNQVYTTDYGLGIKMCEVKHSSLAFGIALTYGGVKIVYSGDTMPCANLLKLGKNCDVLIHEATYSDGMEDRSKVTMHSTLGQAIRMGQMTNAKEVYLTHFTTRSTTLPVTNELLPDNFAFAFDFMKVHLNDTKFLKCVAPAIEKAFYQDIKNLRRKLSQIKKQETIVK